MKRLDISVLLAIHHNENIGGNFTRTRLGLPTEGYAFSSDPPVPLGLPSPHSVRTRDSADGRETAIRMRHP